SFSSVKTAFSNGAIMRQGGVIGGIHPQTPWRDPLANALPAAAVIDPRRIILPMIQGVGKPCEPTVKVGEHVKKYQLVGDCEEKISARIHSGISGKVVSIEKVGQINGKEAVSVEIENDYQNDQIDLDHSIGNDPDRDEICEAVKKAGVIGMGGAGFPSHVKLESAEKIDTCIINGSECEPGLHADDYLMQTQAEEIIHAAMMAQRAVGSNEVFIGIEKDKHKAIKIMRDACREHCDMEVVELPHAYPMGGEKQIIQYITGREVAKGKLPADVGVIVFNVATALAIFNAVQRGLPLTHRVCTVIGDVARPGNVVFPIGTPAQELLDFCGGATGKVEKLAVGGPMMGKAVASSTVPLIKTTNGLIVYAQQVNEFEEVPCIKCDRCSRACPMILLPQFIDYYQRKENWEMLRRLKTRSCINCGCCSYECPSSIPLADNITKAGKKLEEMDKNDGGGEGGKKDDAGDGKENGDKDQNKGEGGQ
ncbi:MAG: electron transport complex subunit RsxC, partial [Planctomycetes bacterium]|nr:electron transport complex subunit RsxC [Planctomycetota bacterium]